jgi:hypothetical protein
VREKNIMRAVVGYSDAAMVLTNLIVVRLQCQPLEGDRNPGLSAPSLTPARHLCWLAVWRSPRRQAG